MLPPRSWWHTCTSWSMGRSRWTRRVPLGQRGACVALCSDFGRLLPSRSNTSSQQARSRRLRSSLTLNNALNLNNNTRARSSTSRPDPELHSSANADALSPIDRRAGARAPRATQPASASLLRVLPLRGSHRRRTLCDCSAWPGQRVGRLRRLLSRPACCHRRCRARSPGGSARLVRSAALLPCLLAFHKHNLSGALSLTSARRSCAPRLRNAAGVVDLNYWRGTLNPRHALTPLTDADLQPLSRHS